MKTTPLHVAGAAILGGTLTFCITGSPFATIPGLMIAGVALVIAGLRP